MTCKECGEVKQPSEITEIEITKPDDIEASFEWVCYTCLHKSIA